MDSRSVAGRRKGRGRRINDRRVADLPVASERRSGPDRRLSTRRFAAWERRARL